MQPPRMAQPMDGAMSEWERAVVIVDTTTQTPNHHNEVMMALVTLTSLGLIFCIVWAPTLITTP